MRAIKAGVSLPDNASYKSGLSPPSSVRKKAVDSSTAFFSYEGTMEGETGVE